MLTVEYAAGATEASVTAQPNHGDPSIPARHTTACGHRGPQPSRCDVERLSVALIPTTQVISEVTITHFLFGGQSISP